MVVSLDSVRAVVPLLVLLPVYPLGLLVLDTRMLGIGSPEVAEPAPRFACLELTVCLAPDPSFLLTVELGFLLGRPPGCDDHSTLTACLVRHLSVYCYCLPVPARSLYLKIDYGIDIYCTRSCLSALPACLFTYFLPACLITSCLCRLA